MPSIDLVNNPFLTVEQDSELSRLDDLCQKLVTPDKSAHLSDHLREFNFESYAVLKGSVKYFNQIALDASAMKFPSNPEDLEKKLQMMASNEVATSTAFDIRSMIGSMAVAARVASDGDHIGLIHALDIANNLVVARARHDATALIGTTTIVHSATFNGGRKTTLWEEAIQTHAENPRLGNTVVISEADNFVLKSLRSKVGDFVNNYGPLPAKPSRFRLLNSTRASKLTRRAVSSATHTNGSKETLEDLPVEILLDDLNPNPSHFAELSEAEIESSVILTERIRKYIANAAKVNPSIASDARARYLTYLSSNLKGQYIKTERDALNRRIAKLSDREKRLQLFG